MQQELPKSNGIGTIRDELDQVLFLSEPKLIISEYIPFGRNSIVAFNKKLDTFKRVKSSLLTYFMDSQPYGTQFKMIPIKIKIDTLDFHPTEFINVNAEIFYGEAEGIEQIEKFGIHINQSGKVILGMNIEEIDGQRDWISIDLYTRLFSDVIFDSSELLSTILSNHQREILKLVFFNRPNNRDKFVCLLGKDIKPNMPAKEYLDDEDKENEIKQVLEYIDRVKDLPDGSKLFIGTHGLIFISNKIDQYDAIIANFGFLKAIDIFLANLLARVFSLEDEAKEIRQQILHEIEKDPRSVGFVQSKLSELNVTAILFEETRERIETSLQDCIQEYKVESKNWNEYQRKLAQELKIGELLQGALARMRDTKKLVEGLYHDVQGLRDHVNVINEKRLQSIFKQLKEDAVIQNRMVKAAERSDSKMQILQIIFAGSLALDIYALFGLNITSKTLEIGFNIGLWVLIVALIFLILRSMMKKAEDTLALRLEYNIPINLNKLDSFLNSLGGNMQGNVELDGKRIIRTITFSKHLERSLCKIELSYDQENGFLNSVNLDIENPRKPHRVYKRAFDEYLKEQEIFDV
jgi:hypothetical protein